LKGEGYVGGGTEEWDKWRWR